VAFSLRWSNYFQPQKIAGIYLNRPRNSTSPGPNNHLPKKFWKSRLELEFQAGNAYLKEQVKILRGRGGAGGGRTERITNG
jgi:hypothetical protein